MVEGHAVTPERHQRMRELFEVAIDLEDEDCRQFLANACKGDDELCREVQLLLSSHRRPGEFLDTPAVILADPGDFETAQPELTGTRIGRYQLLSIIARGGMGIVYEAVQDQPRRIVAIKVMRQGLGSQSALRRFQDEAQILARLRHPNIAQIFEAGTHNDVSVRSGGEPIPYFALEYIPGARSITDYASAHGLSIRDRLALFVKVCDAVHHGHQKGIIHRDIKPANILVDSDGEPKVIDFGVARVTESDVAVTSRQTQMGQILGTVQYMSPEQCESDPHDIDSRSDVYSLGILAYELLSGQVAYDTSSSSLLQAARMIQGTAPKPLSMIDRRLRGDIETIVAKAMEKDRERRYQSAEALKKDIDRYLNGEPIEARRRSAWVGATRWMGKHPIFTSAMSATLVAVIILSTAILAVYYGVRRPSHYEYSANHNTAWLKSGLGAQLETLGGAEEPPDCVKAMIVPRPSRFGGGRVTLYCVKSGQHSTGQQLWVCDPDDLDTPIWSTGNDPLRTRPAIRVKEMAESSDQGYLTYDFAVADVFPEVPGNEIIVVHEQVSDSPNAIRVYDFGGNVLFEAWHFGHLAQVRWWAREGLLIAAGDRHGIPDILRNGFGYPPPWPKVVMALRPRLGGRFGWANERDWPDDWRTDPNITETLVWYKVLMPEEWWQEFNSPMVDIPSGAGTGGPCVVIHFDASKQVGMSLQVNATGDRIVLQSNDEFRKLRSEFPEESPTLVEWPPKKDDR